MVKKHILLRTSGQLPIKVFFSSDMSAQNGVSYASDNLFIIAGHLIDAWDLNDL